MALIEIFEHGHLKKEFWKMDFFDLLSVDWQEANMYPKPVQDLSGWDVRSMACNTKVRQRSRNLSGLYLCLFQFS